MSASIQIPFWPATLDSIRWSSDNLIAISGGEYVAILVPQLKPKHETDPKWQLVNIKVTGFVQMDVPLMAPLSRENWSISEELSQQYVQDHAWSSSGLGQHGSCVLAILHANQVMTIWEYQDKPVPSDKWRRAYILNHTLKDHLQVKSSLENQITEKQQVQQRIRAFSWLGHGRPSSVGSADSRLSSLRALQLMAVANDDGTIFIMEISSPYDILQPERKSWSAKVLLEIDCNEVVRGDDHSINKFTPHRTRIDNMVWGDDHNDGVAILFFIAEQQLFSTEIKLEVTAYDVVRHDITVSLLKGPVKWSYINRSISGPLRCQPGTNEPVFVSSDSLCIGKRTHQMSNMAPLAVSIDTAWSELSGLSMMELQQDGQLVLMSTHLANERFETPMVELKASSAKASAHAPWQEVTKSAISAYAADMDMTSRILTRNWGLATSPTDELVAICTTMLPIESAAHIIASDQVCTLDICQIPNWNPAKLRTKLRSITSEALVSAIQTTEKDNINLLRADQSNDDAKQHIQKLLHETLENGKVAVVQANGTKSTVDDAISSLSSVLQNNSSFHQLKVNRLYSLILQQQPDTAVPREAYSDLVDSITTIAASLPRDDQMSRRILSVHQSARHALAPEEEMQLSEEDLEKCSLCNDAIPFEAFKWARCASGHQFPRCSLTLLAIPQPDVSKSCGLCNARYLNEYAIDDLTSLVLKKDGSKTIESETSGKHSTNSGNSLARVLFAAADRCIFCGGQYTS